MVVQENITVLFTMVVALIVQKNVDKKRKIIKEVSHQEALALVDALLRHQYMVIMTTQLFWTCDNLEIIGWIKGITEEILLLGTIEEVLL